jgi:hypothetical protein
MSTPTPEAQTPTATIAPVTGTPAPAAPAPADTAPQAPEDPQAELAKWKALSRQHEARAKENADKALKFDAAEEANKTELQKALDRAEAAEKVAQAATVDSLRARTAAAKGVPQQLLTGTTVEELEASADALLSFRGPAGPKAGAPDPSGSGGTPTRTYTASQLLNHEFYETNRDDILAAMAEGRIKP